MIVDQTVYLFILAIIIWLVVVSFYLYKTVVHYNRLVSMTGKENLMQVLGKILDILEENKRDINTLSIKLRELNDKSINHIQKVGILRFNPFADTGGDQSFILVMLDGANTGIVMTSLHSRSSTRWYAKRVREGRGVDFQLSEEEEKAINNAVAVTSKKTLEISQFKRVDS